jgi:protein involved in sex pheromone biosynthesis
LHQGQITKPMQVVALRLTEEERKKLRRIAKEHHVTLSWLIREGANLYADDLSKWLAERKAAKGTIGDRIAT